MEIYLKNTDKRAKKDEACLNIFRCESKNVREADSSHIKY